MDAATEYFKLVCQHTFGQTLKPSAEREIHHQRERFPAAYILYPLVNVCTDMQLTHTLNRQRRTPCFPQIDLVFRAILYEQRPPFIILFSHQTTSYSQIFFTHPLFVPSSEIFFDFPSGCPNPCCTEDCEMVRFPRRGLEGAAVLPLKRGRAYAFRKVRAREMCNWIDCDIAFDEEGAADGSESSKTSGETEVAPVRGQVCSKCKIAKYCSAEHQRKDWDEHRRVCAKPPSPPSQAVS